MEQLVLSNLRAMLTNPIPTLTTQPGDGFGRGMTGTLDSIGSPLNDTKMYTFNGILIILSTKTRVGESELNNFLEYADENNYKSGIIILSPSPPSPKVIEAIRAYISNPENQLIQFFEMRQLQIDKSKHKLYGIPHRVLAQDEIRAMMEKYNIVNLKDIPKIDSQDGLGQWVGARPGDVVEILGMCETSAVNERYRYCLADVTNG